MKQPFKVVRDVGGQSMIGVPYGIALGNTYEPVVAPDGHSFTYYIVRSTKPVNNHIVKGTVTQELKTIQAPGYLIKTERPTVIEEKK